MNCSTCGEGLWVHPVESRTWCPKCKKYGSVHSVRPTPPAVYRATFTKRLVDVDAGGARFTREIASWRLNRDGTIAGGEDGDMGAKWFPFLDGVVGYEGLIGEREEEEDPT